jgi:hypothetical protein
VEFFAVIHLMGDPIGALEDLLRKFEGCQARAVFWQAQFNRHDIPSLQDDGVTPESDDNTPTFVDNSKTPQERNTRLWKAFAMITDSYDEWGIPKGDNASQVLSQKLNDLRPGENRQGDSGLTAERLRFCKWCLMTAGALAADRSTKFLPVVVAQAFFIGNIAIAMIRTKSIAQEVNPSTYINIEMYSIAFTALFFWLISAVIMSSIIGASQTAEALPRILDRFSKDLNKAGFPLDLPKKSKADLLSKERVWKGGIYSWQPEGCMFPVYQAEQKAREVEQNARAEAEQNEVATTNAQSSAIWLQVWPDILPFTIFAAAILTGLGVSYAVPPIGWSCRSNGEITIAGICMFSYSLSVLSRFIFRSKRLCPITWENRAKKLFHYILSVLSRYIFRSERLCPITWENRAKKLFHFIFRRELLFSFTFVKEKWATKLFLFTFIKDLVAFSATMVIVIVTQVGWYNKVSCYTKWGEEGLALPQQPATNRILQGGLKVGGSYTVIVTFGVLVQLIIVPLLLLWRYHAAFRVFLQKDDGTSNLDFPRLGWFLKICWVCIKALGRAMASCWSLIRRVTGRAGSAHAHRPLPQQNPEEAGQELE